MHPMRDLIYRSHPSSTMSRIAAIKYRLLLCEGEESGDFCPQLYNTKRLPLEVCHKHRNNRREIPCGCDASDEDILHPVRGSGVRSIHA